MEWFVSNQPSIKNVGLTIGGLVLFFVSNHISHLPFLS